MIDVLDENWDTVQVYLQCGWTVAQETIAGPNGMPITVPKYMGILATEVESSCNLLAIERADRPAIAYGVRFMAATAAKVLNDRGRKHR